MAEKHHGRYVQALTGRHCSYECDYEIWPGSGELAYQAVLRSDGVAPYLLNGRSAFNSVVTTAEEALIRDIETQIDTIDFSQPYAPHRLK